MKCQSFSYIKIHYIHVLGMNTICNNVLLILIICSELTKGEQILNMPNIDILLVLTWEEQKSKRYLIHDNIFIFLKCPTFIICVISSVEKQQWNIKLKHCIEMGLMQV